MNAAQKTSILICDDEKHLREMVGEYFHGRGYAVSMAPDAVDLFRLLDRSKPDLILLDIAMPGMDGLTALQKIRAEFDVPVLMLTAASEVMDKILGLEMGADDYVGKPFDLRELEARVKTVLRRAVKSETSINGSPDRKVKFGTRLLDLDKASLFDDEGSEIPITAMEFSLLKVFANNKGRVLNRDQLLEQAHDRNWDPFDRSIDLRISRLRKKIEINPTKPEIIRTVRGVGYIFG